MAWIYFVRCCRYAWHGRDIAEWMLAVLGGGLFGVFFLYPLVNSLLLSGRQFVGPRLSRGVGLGLAICREIVASHGGAIWVSDNEPRGSAFHVLLPSAARPTGFPTLSGLSVRTRTTSLRCLGRSSGLLFGRPAVTICNQWPVVTPPADRPVRRGPPLRGPALRPGRQASCQPNCLFG